MWTIRCIRRTFGRVEYHFLLEVLIASLEHVFLVEAPCLFLQNYDSINVNGCGTILHVFFKVLGRFGNGFEGFLEDVRGHFWTSRGVQRGELGVWSGSCCPRAARRRSQSPPWARNGRSQNPQWARNGAEIDPRRRSKSPKSA